MRNILSGKYADLMEAGVLSDNGFERLSSAELVEADYDEPKKMVSCDIFHRERSQIRQFYR